MRTWRQTLAALAVCGTMLAGSGGAMASGLSIGGFTLARGGVESLANPDNAKLRKAILKAFPGSTFHFGSKLTGALLAQVRVLVLGVASGGTTPIASLTAAEQKLLLGFAKSGGTVLLFADNDYQFQAVSNSILAPFGLQEGGHQDGSVAASFLTLPSDPIQSGPSGTATAFDTAYPGAFSQTGTGTVLATLPGGAPAIVLFPPGALGSGSGAVVAFSDSDALLDASRTANDLTIILNALALAPH